MLGLVKGYLTSMIVPRRVSFSEQDGNVCCQRRTWLQNETDITQTRKAEVEFRNREKMLEMGLLD
jgi:hypothetical protein